jgi:hypothetical protein
LRAESKEASVRRKKLKKKQKKNTNKIIRLTEGAVNSLVRSIPIFALKPSCFVERIWHRVAHALPRHDIARSLGVGAVV